MSQLHKKFTDRQVKDLFGRYLNKEIERSYLQQILGLSKSRFFHCWLLTAKTHKLSPFSIKGAAAIVNWIPALRKTSSKDWLKRRS